MRELVARSTLSDHPRPRARGPLALCLAVAAALTFLVDPRASRAPVPPASEPVSLAPVTAVAPDLPDEPTSPDESAMADLLIVGRGGFRPMKAIAGLFSQPQGGMRALIATAAAANDLPPDFFLRLLHQESGLNPMAVSPAGAQGIAQFMPSTALERGLRDPFDPAQAIPKSAELLREHRVHFGNLGLAAAAYNAGPQRVRWWLDGRSGMPAETRAYVVRITGRTIEDWATESGRSASRSVATFTTTQDPGFAAAWTTPALGQKANLSLPHPAPRGGLAAARIANRLPPHPPERSQQPRSERALCALLNGEGRTCLVQATY